MDMQACPQGSLPAEIKDTRTALYTRLSSDDGNLGESMSIQSQICRFVGEIN